MTTHQRDEQGGALALLHILRRRIGVVLACALLLPGAALAFSLAQEKQYSASSSLLFRDPQFDQKLFGSTVFEPIRDPAREAETNVKLVSLDVVADRTARALTGRRLTKGDVQSKVTVQPEGKSDVVSITATDHDPRFAARLSNLFAEQYIAFRRDADRSKIYSAQQLIERQIGRLPEPQRTGERGRSLRERAEQLQILASLQTGNAELVQTASPPTAASSPNPVRNTVLGLGLGVLLGLGLAILLERLDRRLKDPKEIADAFDRPILGAIPESRAIATADQDAKRLAPGEAEAFRMLRANLRYFNVDSEVRSVLITSSSPGDGKSTVAMHLASAGAAAGSRVALIEADLRHPTLARRVGLPPERGLSQLLAGEIGTLRDAAHSVPVAGRRRGDPDFRTMDVVVSGPIPPNPTDLIESERMHEVMQEASREYDLVVVDTPPTSVVSDAIPLVKQVSGVIVVCRLAKTTRESAYHLRNQLANLEANTLGVVINSAGRGRGYHHYGYGYGYGPIDEKRKKGDDTSVLPPPTPVTEAQNGHSDRDVEIPAPAEAGASGARAEANGPPPARPQRPPRPVPPAPRRRGGILGGILGGRRD
ncbi:MAG TPA: polysaccharide biosynthesis tyrosine autokinase [Thermoleophilaceae bacterium]